MRGYFAFKTNKGDKTLCFFAVFTYIAGTLNATP